MPTTIAVASRDTDAQTPRNVFAIMENPDLVVVAAFTAVGLLLSIGLVVLFPISDHLVTLLASSG